MPVDVDEIAEQVEADLGERLADVGEFLTEKLVRAYYATGHVRTGEMVKSVRYVVDPNGKYVKIVVDDFVSAFLEFGTKHQRADNVLARTVEENVGGVIEKFEGNGT